MPLNNDIFRFACASNFNDVFISLRSNQKKKGHSLGNFLGMTPYSFTVTSHVIVTFCLAMISFLAITIFAIARNGFVGFFHMFLPSGVPGWMAPMIFLIEFFPQE